MTSEVHPLFADLFDDAGLFPPESLDLSQALARHRADLEAQDPALTHRFVCRPSDVADLVEADPDGGLAVILVTSTSADHWSDELTTAAQLLGPRLRQIEVAVAEGDSVADALTLTHAAAPGVDVCVEPFLGAELLTDLEAIKAAGAIAKVRCGGTDPVVSLAYLAGFVLACRQVDVPFKATAGLHDSVFRPATETESMQHGFLNVVLAVALAEFGADPDQVRWILQEQAPLTLSDRIVGLRPELVRATRQRLVSIGSCSTSEPVEDLRSLGLHAGVGVR